MITFFKKLYRKILDNITRIYFKIYMLYTKIYSIVFFTNMPDIKTHLTLEEKYLLHTSISHNSICVEIGSYLGASSCYIAASKNCQKLYCIDTWANEGMSEGLRDTFDEFIINTKQFQNKIITLRGKSYDIGKNFSQNIDFLFIDGDHSYDGVKKDIEIWLPKLRSNGILMMHDCGWATGVQKVIIEDVLSIMKKYQYTPNMFIGVRK